MSAIIDLGSELIVDASRVRDPYVRLLLAAIGQELAAGSPWLALEKRVVAASGLVWEPAAGGEKQLGLSSNAPNSPRRMAATALGRFCCPSTRAVQ